MSEIKAGSGLTTSEIMQRLQESSAENYRAMLVRMGVKGRNLENQVGSFRDGMSTTLAHLVKMGIVTLAK